MVLMTVSANNMNKWLKKKKFVSYLAVEKEVVTINCEKKLI